MTRSSHKGPTLGLKYMKTAYVNIKGFDLMRMFKEGQMNVWYYGLEIIREIH